MEHFVIYIESNEVGPFITSYAVHRTLAGATAGLLRAIQFENTDLGLELDGDRIMELVSRIVSDMQDAARGCSYVYLSPADEHEADADLSANIVRVGAIQD